MREYTIACRHLGIGKECKYKRNIEHQFKSTRIMAAAACACGCARSSLSAAKALRLGLVDLVVGAHRLRVLRVDALVLRRVLLLRRVRHLGRVDQVGKHCARLETCINKQGT